MIVLTLLNLQTNKHGGTEEYLRQMGVALRAIGSRHVVALRAIAPELKALLEASGVDVLELSDLTDATIDALVRHVRPDIVVLNFFGTFGAIASVCVAAGARKVVVVDDHSGPIRALSPLALSLRRARARLSMNGVDRVVGVSDFVTKRLRNALGDDDRIYRVYNGVRAPVMRASLDDGADWIVCAGYMIQEKGFQTLIRAFEALHTQHPKARLALIGDGPWRHRLQAIAAPMGDRVVFAGQRDDVPELMAGARVVVVPSLWQEAFGFVVAEAMRAGVVVVASRTGGIPELIEHGETGLLFPPGDVDALTAQLQLALVDEVTSARVRTAARAYANKHFCVERMVSDMIALFHEVFDVYPTPYRRRRALSR